MKDDYEFFWTGFYSQWHPVDMTIKLEELYEVLPFLKKWSGKVIKFNTCEQWMMFCKAVLFEDMKTAQKILKADRPKEQKALGRKVDGFDESVWIKWCDQIVFQGNFHKFSQNSDILEIMMAVPKSKAFVEASPVDKIWGIGRAEDDPLAWEEKTWNGKNKLGKALDRVRETLSLKD